jgi:hypothetical protein
MAAPHLDTCCFPKLLGGSTKDNHGTVTSADLRGGETVTIRSKGTSKIWSGKVIDQVPGHTNTWNAVVNKVHDDSRVTETVGVTVTNSGGESNEVKQDPEIV